MNLRPNKKLTNLLGEAGGLDIDVANHALEQITFALNQYLCDIVGNIILDECTNDILPIIIYSESCLISREDMRKKRWDIVARSIQSISNDIVKSITGNHTSIKIKECNISHKIEHQDIYLETCVQLRGDWIKY